MASFSLVFTSALVILATFGNCQLPLEEFISFGEDVGDTALGGDDTFSPEIDMGFTFYGAPLDSFYISTNGYLTGSTDSIRLEELPSERAVIAVFAEDINVNAGGNIFYRTISDEETLDEISSIILDAYQPYGLMNFEATEAFVATWHQVPHYNSATFPGVNTFQVVIATNNLMSFVIFHYADLAWHNQAQVAISAGDNARVFFETGSGTDAILNINTGSNVNLAGRYVYKVDSTQVLPAKQGFSCENDNPCSPLFSDNFSPNNFGVYHYKSSEGPGFIQCSLCSNQCVARACGPLTEWDQVSKTCALI